MRIRGAGALVTGASQGLGRALALALAREGARLALVARRRAPLEEVAARIRDAGGRAVAVAADVGAADAACAVAAQAAEALGRVDLLVHNASTLGHVPLRLLVDSDDRMVEEVFQVNALGPFRLSKALLGPMLLAEGGLVLGISSDAAVEAYPGWGPYGAAKAALDHLHAIWAAELAGTGVRFLSVDPGEMATRMHADAMPDADPAELATPESVAARIVELVRKAESAPSGARLVAGGRPVPA